MADGLSGRSGEEQSGMDTFFFDDAQLLELKYDDNGEEEDAEAVELEGIDMSTWEKKNRHWVVPEESGLEILCLHYDTQVAEH